MKLLKKILWLGATACMAFGFGTAAIGCDGDPAPTTPPGPVVPTPPDGGDPVSYVYRVSVQNETGFGFANLTVNLMNGSTVVASKKTNSAGNANFLAEDVANAGVYTVVVEELPAGYEYTTPDLTYKTLAEAGTQIVITIKPTGLLQGNPPAGHGYDLGSVMYDFTVTLPDNSEYTLSKILETKKLVLINFWYQTCGPCNMEFPFMDTAARAYADDVSVLAISTQDSNGQVRNFQETKGYDAFNMASSLVSESTSDARALMNMFTVSAAPHTVLVDRYGVVVYEEIGALKSVGDFTVQFDKFVGDDYLPTVVTGKDVNDDPDDSTEDVKIKPNVAAPSISDVKTAFASDPSASGFSFRFQEEEGLEPGDDKYDEYNWPWSVSEDKQYIYASNRKYHSSYAILYSEVSVQDGDVLYFEYKLDTEEDCDVLYIIIDGMLVKEYSGHYSDQWYETYAYLFREEEKNTSYTHTVSFVFMKDSETTVGDDVVQLKGLCIKNESELNSPDVEASIFRQAATFFNTDENATTQFKQYVDVVYNPADEYYHVGSADGPTLYANMMNASQWSHSSFWLLAFNDYVVGNGMNYHYAVEEFAWEAAQVTSVNGYAPVTRDLKYLLDIATRYVSYQQKWDGPYHDKEWLELCVYWEHYGTQKIEDPLAGISFTSAIKMHTADESCDHKSESCQCANEISVPYALNPRGFKYKFTPAEGMSGAYKVYSVGDSDPIVFLLAEDRKTHLGYWDNKIFADYEVDDKGNDISDDNFEFYWYFEEGKTYYLLFTTYLDMAAKYDVYIEYMGKSYTYLENAAVGPYSANLNTFELFLPDAIEYEYADPTKTYFYANENKELKGDGYYHHKLADGSLGGIIYLDVARTTAFFTTHSIYDITEAGLEIENEQLRAFYCDGVDYTEYFFDLAFAAMKQTEKQGFVAVTAEVFEKLNKITMSSKYDGIKESWLLLCYYDKTLGDAVA